MLFLLVLTFTRSTFSGEALTISPRTFFSSSKGMSGFRGLGFTRGLYHQGVNGGGSI